MSSSHFKPDFSRGPDTESSRESNHPNSERTHSAHPDVEAARRSIREVISGRSIEFDYADSSDEEIRIAVAEELLDVICSGEDEAASNGDGVFQQEVRERARELFRQQGYLDEAVNTLRTAEAPEERCAAARTIGVVGSERETTSLIAALFDNSADVRRAAEKALIQTGDPTLSFGRLSSLVNDEINWGASELILSPETNGVSPAQLFISKDSNEVTPDLKGNRPAAAGSQLSADELLIADAISDLDRLSKETAAAREAAEDKVRRCVASELSVRSQVTERRRLEELQRKRTEEEAMRRRLVEDEELEAEHSARLQAEAEARYFSEQEASLRLEVLTLRKKADAFAQSRVEAEEAARAASILEAQRARHEVAQRQIAEQARLQNEEEVLRRAEEQTVELNAAVATARREAEIQFQQLEEEKAQLAATEVAIAAEAARVRREAEEALREAENRNRWEQEQLSLQTEELRRLTEEVDKRRWEIEAARQKAENDARQLEESQRLMKVAEEDRRQTEAERLEIQADLFKRAETERNLLEQVRSRMGEQQQLLEEAARQRNEEEERGLAKLVALKDQLEASARGRKEEEGALIAELESLRIAEIEVRNRIEEAEINKRRAEEAQGLITEKLQRVEAEGHARALEEGRILAKLEGVRRSVAQESQAREEQEQCVRDEIERFRGLEEEQRLRLADAIRDRVAAESRLQHQKDLYKAEQEARIRAEAALELLTPQQKPLEEIPEWRDDPAENLRPVKSAPAVPYAPVASAAFAGGDSVLSAGSVPGQQFGEPITAPPPAGELHNNDPLMRAAVLSALAQAGDKDAFNFIVSSFDDPSVDVRNAAARALRELEPYRPVEPFTRALEEGSSERRQNICGAITTSGLAAEAIAALSGESRAETYNALCLLYAMAKTGAVQPLVQAVEKHQDVEVRRAAVKLLTLTGQTELAEAAAKRRLGGRTEGHAGS